MTKEQTILYWKSNIDSAGIRADVETVYIKYITRLINNDVPIIFDFKHLHLLLGRSPTYLASVINANEKHYRAFEIPKRSHGVRQIFSPYPALLECQYWIYENILKKVEVHGAAHGFTSNKSIITNSKFHVNQKDYLKIDFKNFFPSIKIHRVIAVFKKLGYSHKVSFYLASLCCYNDQLPQGAPTSPILSNIVVKHLDNRLLKFAKKSNLKYTRYADDLALSGPSISPKTIAFISKIIADFDLEINPAKTILQQNRSKRILTGVSIADKELKLPRQYKRRLRQEIHFIRKYGLSSHVRKLKIRNPHYLLTIIGRIGFWLNVEPDCDYAKTSLLYLKGLSN